MFEYYFLSHMTFFRNISAVIVKIIKGQGRINPLYDCIIGYINDLKGFADVKASWVRTYYKLI